MMDYYINLTRTQKGITSFMWVYTGRPDAMRWVATKQANGWTFSGTKQENDPGVPLETEFFVNAPPGSDKNNFPTVPPGDPPRVPPGDPPLDNGQAVAVATACVLTAMDYYFVYTIVPTIIGYAGKTVIELAQGLAPGSALNTVAQASEKVPILPI